MKNNYNFLITGVDEETYDLTIKHLAQQYVQDANFCYNLEIKEDRINIRLDFQFSDDKVFLMSDFNGGYSSFSNILDCNNSKELKRLLSKEVVKLFNLIFDYILPWGILTGIRPTKLYHMLYKQHSNHSVIREILKEDYLLLDESIDILERIFKTQIASIPDIYEINEKEVSIYVGIPFCPTKCAYCTFPAYQIRKNDERLKPFLEMLFEEIDLVFDIINKKNKDITTIYIGGGTPTSLTAEDLERVLVKLYSKINRDKLREITVEAGRPDTIDTDKLKILEKYNVDRISVNPQSFNNITLRAIGRIHSVEETINKYHLSREYIPTINMDMIVGLPGENSNDIKNTLQNFKELIPENITVHALSFKRASTMTKNKSRYPVATGEEAENMLVITKIWMQENNYIPYYLYRQKNILANMENIGYSKEGHINLYNIIIMEEVQTIIGIGCGASSKIIEKNGTIHSVLNPKDPISYSNYSNQIGKKLQLMKDYL